MVLPVDKTPGATVAPPSSSATTKHSGSDLQRGRPAPTAATIAAPALLAQGAASISVSNTLAWRGSSAKRVDIQAEFTDTLQNILKQGVGNLVDPDLAAESAGLQALQIKQELGGHSLAIANADPQNILALFQ